jgi:5-methylcytosine-specific restriction endonuclease McrA
MARSISASIRNQVIRRAKNCCEYCQLSQQGQEATFHIDHILPVSAGGETIVDNLALACVSCSLRKAARQTAIDPETREDTPLFHPRKHRWKDHFQWLGFRVIGITPIGRATVNTLQINRSLIISIREEEAKLGRHPNSKE